MRKNKMTALLSLACAATLAAGVGVVAMNNMPVAEAETAHTEAIFMANGASIRYSNPSGIRFIGYVDEDVYTEGSVVGMKITVGGVEKVFSTETIEGASWQWTESDVAGYKKFNVAITEIPASAYETEMTAQAFVDEETSAEIVTRSIANVAVAALAADTLEDKLLDGNVTKLENYVNDAAVALPFDATEVSVQSGNLVFDAVENAKGYLVQMGSKMTNIPATSAETYSVPVGDFEGTIKMLPYGDGVAYRYAETACAVKANPAMIADFGDASYINSIGAVVGENWTGAAGEQNSAIVEVPSFEKEGTPAGTVTFRAKIDDYRGGTSNWSRLAAFTVTLPEALNLANGYDGIKVKLYLNEISLFASKVQTATLELLDESKKTGWNDNKSTVSVTIGDGVTSPTGEMELYISNSSLAAFGYATGDTMLTFGIRGTSNTNANTGCYVDVSMDYIKYYTTAELLATLPLAANELANFDYEAYTSAIDYIGGQNYTTFVTAPSYADGKVSFTIRNDDYRDPHADWTNIAAFKVTLPKALDTTKGDGITVKLYVNKATQAGKLGLELLDDSKMTSWCTTKSAASVTIGEDGVANTGWLELFVTNAQLAQLGYATGDTTLTLGLRNASNGSHYDAYSWNVSIDYIKYYNAAELLAAGLAEDELANFNDAAYTGLVQYVSGSRYYPGSASGEWKTAPSYADGIVSMNIHKDKYGSETQTNVAAFTVTLPKALDLTKGGIKVRMYAHFSSDENEQISVQILNPNDKANWSTATVEMVAPGWQELTISSAQLQALGYKTGDTVLTIGVYTTTKNTVYGGYNVKVQLDWIKYYAQAES